MKELKKQVRSIKLECPSCGAGMEVNEDKTRASCPYCGYEMILETRDVYREEYERRRARAQAEEEAQQARTKAAGRRKLRAWGIAAAVIAAFMLIGALIPGTQTHQLFFPIEADPFAELKVTFSGDDGEGKVQVKSEAPGELREIEYEVAPATGLRNGDVVEIRAKRLPGYRFSPSVKEVTVEGLPMWVDATADLSEDHLAQLHANTERLIREEEPEAFARRGADPLYFAPPGGENMVRLRYRVLEALRKIARRSGEKDLILVTHAGVINAVKCLLGQGDFTKILEMEKPAPGSVTVLEV